MSLERVRWLCRAAVTNGGRIVVPVVVLVALAAQISPGIAQRESFYQGKTIRMVPYVAPGSGTDLQSRFIVRCLPKYLPGNPKVIIQNMPEGGGDGAVKKILGS